MITHYDSVFIIIIFSFSTILKDALTGKYSSVSSGHVAGLARSRMNGSIPFEKTIEQTKAVPLAPKKYQLLHHDEKQSYKLTRAATSWFSPEHPE